MRKLPPAPASFAAGWLLNFVSRSHADYLSLLAAFVLAAQVNREAFLVPKGWVVVLRLHDTVLTLRAWTCHFTSLIGRGELRNCTKLKTLEESVHLVKHANLWRSCQATLKPSQLIIAFLDIPDSIKKGGYINEPFTHERHSRRLPSASKVRNVFAHSLQMAINSVSLKQDERTFNSSFIVSAYQGWQKKRIELKQH